MALTRLALLTRGTSLACALVASIGAQAAVVENSLPFTNSTDWTTITFAGTAMELNPGGTSSTLGTAFNRGVWFGYYPAVDSTDVPAWTPGNSSQGNYLSLEASFSTGAADWSAYLYDRTSYAFMAFNPTTGCDSNVRSCYGEPAESGVRVYHANGNDATTYASTFVNMDLKQRHSFEFLLKNGQVAYRVDGQVIYAGMAYAIPINSPLLIIGDGSGSSLSGEGTMTIYSVAFDNAPLASTLAPVPEPQTWAMLLGGLLALGAARRRQAIKSA